MARLIRKVITRKHRELTPDDLGIDDLLSLQCGGWRKTDTTMFESLLDLEQFWRRHGDCYMTFGDTGRFCGAQPGTRPWAAWAFDYLPKRPRLRVVNDKSILATSSLLPPGRWWWQRDSHECSLEYLHRNRLLLDGELALCRAGIPAETVYWPEQQQLALACLKRLEVTKS